jgi:cbb3-type cytochrome oxidase subunit 1
MVHAKQERKPALDTLYAKSAFWLSLGFWIPLFNIGLCIMSIIIAVIAMRRILKEPTVYGGLKYAVIALVLSISSLVLTIVGAVLYLFSSQICATALCTAANPLI